MGNQFDDKLREALHVGTQSSAELKDQTLQRIQSKLRKNGREQRKVYRFKEGSRMKRVVGFVTVAAVLTLTFMTTTQPGQAALKKIREFFEPEKGIVQEIEGQPEDMNAVLGESEMGYIIYYEEDRFEMESTENKDRIVPMNHPDTVPEVYMEITQQMDEDPEELADQIYQSLQQEYVQVNDIKRVENPVEGSFIYADKGYDSQSEVVKYYIVDNTRGGAFIIKQRLFVEANEGFGARYDQMLEEFRIVDLDQ